MPQKIIIKFFLLLSMAVLFIACPGNNSNLVDTTRYTSIDGGDTGGGTTPTYSYTVSDIINHTMGQAPACSSGERLANLNVINVDVISPTTLYVSGDQNSGLLSNKVVAYYIGESYSKDLMIICKTDDDRWNVTVSFCPYKTIVTSLSVPLAFESGSAGITIDSNTSGLGSVVSAKNTLIKIRNGSVELVFGPTTFYPIQTQ